jgi:hypothetical protein
LQVIDAISKSFSTVPEGLFTVISVTADVALASAKV